MPSFGSKIVVDSVKSLAKLKVKDNDYSSVIYKPSCFITEGNQVSEVSFTLGKCTLVVPGYLFLPVPRKVFQEDKDFHMGCSEAEQPTVSLWAFFSRWAKDLPFSSHWGPLPVSMVCPCSVTIELSHAIPDLILTHCW